MPQPNLTLAILERLCNTAPTPGSAYDLCEALGALAPWWASNETAQLASVIGWQLPSPFPPLLAPDPGSCGVIFAALEGCHLLLRRAFLLPLIWRADTDDSADLPPAIGALARQVRADLAKVPKVSSRRWGLHLNPGGPFPDLRGLDMPAGDVRSGWAALAAGLVVVAEGGEPDPRVLATGAWHPQTRLARVEGIDVKVGFAVDYRAKHLFVPEGQTDAAVDFRDAHGETGLSIGLLPRGRNPAEQQALGALANLLSHLEVAPQASAPFSQRRDYYCRQFPRDRGLAEGFYRDRLLPTIVQQRREQFRADYSGLALTHLITFASFNWEMVPLAAGATGVRRCLILHTADNGALVQAATRKITDLQIPCEPVPCRIDNTANIDEMAQQIATHLHEKCADAPPNELAFDLTPGSKVMTLGATRAAHPDACLIYLGHQFIGRDLRDPGTEHYHAFRTGQFLAPPGSSV